MVRSQLLLGRKWHAIIFVQLHRRQLLVFEDFGQVLLKQHRKLHNIVLRGVCVQLKFFVHRGLRQRVRWTAVQALHNVFLQKLDRRELCVQEK